MRSVITGRKRLIGEFVSSTMTECIMGKSELYRLFSCQFLKILNSMGVVGTTFIFNGPKYIKGLIQILIMNPECHRL
jgi:hypothetical protein